MIYHVDAIDGDDAADGLSERGAWASTAQHPMYAGDTLLFRRGGVWNIYGVLPRDGTPEQPITIGAYGAGPRPTIQLDAREQAGNRVGIDIPGSYIRLSGLRVTLVNAYRNPAYPVTLGGLGARWGWLVGVSISGHHVTVDDCEFDHLALGVNLTDSASDCLITGCHFHDLNAMWALGGAPYVMGAVAVMLHGTANVVDNCRMERNHVQWTKPDGTVVTYSAAIEAFNANGCIVRRCVMKGHRKTAEYGKHPDKTCADNIFEDCIVDSDALNGRGLNMHGVGTPENPDIYGPVERTVVKGNTFIFTGQGSQGLISGYPGATVENNILSAKAKSIFVAGRSVVNRNIYTGGGQVQVSYLSEGLNWKTDPLLDPVTYAPLPGSPCLGAASDGGSIGAVQPEPASVDQAEYDRLLAELADAKLTVEILSDILNKIWGLLYPEDPTSWEYPGQVLNHIQVEITRYVQARIERDAALADVDRLRDALTRVGAEVVAALEGVQP
jgi:hypothetical protein